MAFLAWFGFIFLGFLVCLVPKPPAKRRVAHWCLMFTYGKILGDRCCGAVNDWTRVHVELNSRRHVKADDDGRGAKANIFYVDKVERCLFSSSKIGDQQSLLLLGRGRIVSSMRISLVMHRMHRLHLRLQRCVVCGFGPKRGGERGEQNRSRFPPTHEFEMPIVKT